VDTDRLAAVLAENLSAIVPPEILIEARNGMLYYSTDPAGRFGYKKGTSGTYIRGNFGILGQSDEENIVNISVQALDELQDFVSETTTDPWPGTTRQPQPHGEVRDSVLYLWYGDPGEPALACVPMQLTDLAG
jgi:hypothetical protein